MPIVTTTELKINQLLAVTDTPVKIIVHGWHLTTNGHEGIESNSRASTDRKIGHS